jgi:hypothetical protein
LSDENGDEYVSSGMMAREAEYEADYSSESSAGDITQLRNAQSVQKQVRRL